MRNKEKRYWYDIIAFSFNINITTILLKRGNILAFVNLSIAIYFAITLGYDLNDLIRERIEINLM